jgi:flagellar basal body rod protein FlgF
MQALRTAASGMSAQQLNVEVISNNIANMNTVGFKRQRAEFQDLLYQTIERAGSQSSSDGNVVPTGVQVGGGVKAGSVYRITEQGTPTLTDNPLDVAIQGKGLPADPAALGRDRLHPRRQLLDQRPGPDRHRGRLHRPAGHHRSRRTPPTSRSARPAWCR